METNFTANLSIILISMIVITLIVLLTKNKKH